MDTIVRNFDDIPVIQEICGEIRQLISREDFEQASAAVAIITAPTVPHIHSKTTEFYFVIEGKGKIFVRGLPHWIKENDLVAIPPNSVHYTIPRTKMKVLVFAVPAWVQDDQTVLDLAPNSSLEYQEKFALIDEILCRAGLEFREGMSQTEKEDFDVERQALVLRAGWNGMSNAELRKVLEIK